MKKYKVLIAHNHSSIEILHTLVPLYLLSKNSLKYSLKFIDFKFFNKFQKADILILTRKYHNFNISINKNRKIILNDIKRYKNQFKKVIYFDDSAAVSHILYFILPFVDSYWVRGLLKDKSQYEKKLYGGRTFSDFYFEKYKIVDEIKIESPSFKYINDGKIKVAWNIGIGCFPIYRNNIYNRYYFVIRKLCCILSFFSFDFLIIKIISFYIFQMKKELKNKTDTKLNNSLISARFTYENYSNSVGFNRKLAFNKIKDNYKFIKGKLSLWNYIEECSRLLAIFSPFGWGEICYRDFEAILSKSLLIKPDMGHLETWPNIYKKSLYYKLDWEFKTIKDIDNFVDKNNKQIYSIINNASYVYLKALEDCTSRAELLLDQIIS